MKSGYSVDSESKEKGCLIDAVIFPVGEIGSGMSRRLFFVTSLTPEDVEWSEKILKSASSYTTQAMRLWNNVAGFLELNRAWFLQHETSDEMKMCLFFGQALSQRMSARTVKGFHAMCKRFGITPSTLAEARIHILRQQITSGLERLAVETPFKRTKVYPGTEALLRMCNPADGHGGHGSESRRLYRAFWFLLIVTGARPANLRKAPISLTDQGVIVYWKGRKVRDGERSQTLYPYRWTAKPPNPEVLSTLQEVVLDGWGLLKEAEQPASYINGWLRRFPDTTEEAIGHWTSTTPRDNLVSILQEYVTDGVMTERRYEWLLDHTVHVGMQHYANLRGKIDLEEMDEDEYYSH